MDTIATGTGDGRVPRGAPRAGRLDRRASRSACWRGWRARCRTAWGPDHLTALGFAGMLLTGAAYALSGRNPLFLHAANLGLLVNWFGDSLDGTLARHRGRLRPRYGFYVDHVIDAFGATAVLGGLAASGLMAPGGRGLPCSSPTCSSPCTSTCRRTCSDGSACRTRGRRHRAAPRRCAVMNLASARVADASRWAGFDRAPARRGRRGRRYRRRDRAGRVGRLDHARALPSRAGLGAGFSGTLLGAERRVRALGVHVDEPILLRDPGGESPAPHAAGVEPAHVRLEHEAALGPVAEHERRHVGVRASARTRAGTAAPGGGSSRSGRLPFFVQWRTRIAKSASSSGSSGSASASSAAGSSQRRVEPGVDEPHVRPAPGRTAARPASR